MRASGADGDLVGVQDRASCSDGCGEGVQLVLQKVDSLQFFLESWAEEQTRLLTQYLSRERYNVYGFSEMSKGDLRAVNVSSEVENRDASPQSESDDILNLQASRGMLSQNSSGIDETRRGPSLKRSTSGFSDHVAPASLMNRLNLSEAPEGTRFFPSLQSPLSKAIPHSFLAKHASFSVRSNSLTSSMLPVMTWVSTSLTEEPPVPEGCLRRWIARSPTFEVICACVILLNAALMAYFADYEAKHHEEPTWAQPTEMSFCLFYVVELMLRVYARRLRFYFTPDWRWNVMDTFLVATSVQEQVSLFVTVHADRSNLSFLRILRLLKMIKVLRMVRLMRMFREFRMLLNAIAGSLKAVFWALLLICVMSFIFGLVILQGVTGYLRDYPDTEYRDLLQRSWGSVPASMLSLYKANTNGTDWAELGDILSYAGGIYYGLFLIYIAFYTCVVTNTITSLFVESTIAFAEKDTASIISDKLAHQEDYVRKLQTWFNAIDASKRGTITYDQFVGNVDDPAVLAFAQTLEIELLDLKQFFAVISCNGRRAVNLENFVLGCIKLKGMAKSMDLMSLMYSHREATNEHKVALKRFEQQCMFELRQIGASISRDSAEPMRGSGDGGDASVTTTADASSRLARGVSGTMNLCSSDRPRKCSV
eukprot:TRINITY_DN7200_c0_g2_i1.p1 TRINITY_DN7200_c0_g2~~TRINITY_DN7200_c0_g2_i1.p1  ORF type:complete len:651 (-),score=64.46 TRINITY_DN7200_c0_g2_i1:602-2554(-)